MHHGALHWFIYNRYATYLILLVTTIVIIGSPLQIQAQAGIGYYSPSSPPAGMKSLEPLIGQWWNGWVNHPPSYIGSWPSCVKWESTIGHNQSVVFLADPASASGSNVNATKQSCVISPSQALFLSVYEGECSTAEYPGYSPPQLLKCAQDSNQVIRLMQVKVDGNDVSSNIIRQSTSRPYNVTFPTINTYDLKAPEVGKFQAMGETYYLFFKPLPKGDHMITVEVIRVPLQANQPVEHDLAKWSIKVV